MDVPNLFSNEAQVNILSMLGKKGLIARFYPETDHPAARLLHEPEQVPVYMLSTNSAIEGHSERPIDQHVHHIFDTLSVKRKLIVIEIDMPDTKPPVQKPEMFVHVLRRVISVAPSEHRAVAVTARVRTSPARNAACIGGCRVIEDGKGIGMRVTFQFMVCRKGKRIKVYPFGTVSRKTDLSITFTIDETLYFYQSFA